MIAIKQFCNRFFVCFFLLQAVYTSAAQEASLSYKKVQEKLAHGWHTYNNASVLSHVYMPSAFSIKLSLKSNRVGLYGYMGDAFFSAKVPRPEKVHPVAYNEDGSYTELLLYWDGNTVRVQSAAAGDDIVLLVTPIETSAVKPSLVVETGFLWNYPGQIKKAGAEITAMASGKTIIISSTALQDTAFLSLSTPYLTLGLQAPVGVYSGARKTLAQVQALIQQKQAAHEHSLSKYNEQAPVVQVIQNAIGWNTVYDPLNQRVITPVSRYWSEAFGGPYVLFDWDTYFGAYMASLFNKELAFSNAIAITKSLTPGGFVPNYSAGGSKASSDRSQPPVGSTIVREIYRKYPEKWFLQTVFNDLLTWNRWWIKARRTPENWLCWGSDTLGDPSANTWQAAAYESGLDNAPMYDSVPFNKATHRMELADVGLQSLYIMDCESLADIAAILGEKKAESELLLRAKAFRQALTKLWHEPTGQYLNYRTDTKQFNTTTSPTTFYPLLIKQPNEQQAKRMVSEHLQNKSEYAGPWILPSCPINHPAYTEQNYWRGRIWGPLNLLVYLGIRQYHFPQFQKELVAKSKALLVTNYNRTNGYVYENYNAITGKGREEGEGVNASDNFYHWGALLGFISLIENGHMDEPLKKISR
jgi:hypothetical protein